MTPHQNCLAETVLIMGQQYVFMKKYRKLSPNYPCYPFLTGTLIIIHRISLLIFSQYLLKGAQGSAFPYWHGTFQKIPGKNIFIQSKLKHYDKTHWKTRVLWTGESCLSTCCHKAELTHFILETPKGVLAKSADPDQMPHNVASDLGLHYFASCSTIFQQKYLN